MKQSTKNLLAGLALGGVTAASHAAIDVSAATAGIADAATGIAAVIGALMTLSVGIFGVVKVYRFVSKRAGS